MTGTPSAAKRAMQYKFAGRDSARQRRQEHRQGPKRALAAATVFLRSIAIVSQRRHRYRRERPGYLGHFRMNISDYHGSSTLVVGNARRLRRKDGPHGGRIRHPINTNVDHSGAGSDKVARDESRTTDGRDQDVGRRVTPGRSPSSRVANRDRCIPLQEQARQRLSNNLLRPTIHAPAPAMSMRLRSSSSITPAGVQGARTRGPGEQADIYRMKAVDVLGRVEGIEHPLRSATSHRARQRRLDQDSVVQSLALRCATSCKTSSMEAVAGRRWKSTDKPVSPPALTLLRT